MAVFSSRVLGFKRFENGVSRSSITPLSNEKGIIGRELERLARGKGVLHPRGGGDCGAAKSEGTGAVAVDRHLG